MSYINKYYVSPRVTRVLLDGHPSECLTRQESFKKKIKGFLHCMQIHRWYMSMSCIYLNDIIYMSRLHDVMVTLLVLHKFIE